MNYEQHYHIPSTSTCLVAMNYSSCSSSYFKWRFFVLSLVLLFCWFVLCASSEWKNEKKKHNLLPLFLVDILMLDAHMKMIYFYTNCLNFLPLLLSVAITTSATTLFIFLNAILCLHTLISTMNSEVEHSPPYHFLSQKNGLSINFRERGFLPS